MSLGPIFSPFSLAGNWRLFLCFSFLYYLDATGSPRARVSVCLDCATGVGAKHVATGLHFPDRYLHSSSRLYFLQPLSLASCEVLSGQQLSSWCTDQLRLGSTPRRITETSAMIAYGFLCFF